MNFVFDDMVCWSNEAYFRFRPQVRLNVEVDEERGDDSDVEYPDVVECLGYSAAVVVQVAQIQNY